MNRFPVHGDLEVIPISEDFIAKDVAGGGVLDVHPELEAAKGPLGD